jgi:hypothetical protein
MKVNNCLHISFILPFVIPCVRAQCTKAQAGGEDWQVQFLSELHFPFALEISVRRDALTEKRYVLVIFALQIA